MDHSGVSFTRPHEPMSLMKMGLCMVLVGHVNFLLAALVHGTVLRHITLDTQTLEYAISNILALTAGLVGILVGILTIVFSKNEKNRVLTWWVCMLSAVGGVLAAATVVGLLVALVWTFIYGTKGLLLHCNLPDDMSYFSITFECPFDPTRIYVETLRAAVPPVIPCHVPPPRCCHRDCELVRPPEQHELLRASRPYSSSRSAQNRAASSQFNRASLNRASFWI
ncbi:transmembrane protein 54b isoform X3 [Ictalurus furcatus]|uniref:transmembrane protein 54b isoform X3 n=1 Tax=Ictalurus furcatus TaxID=66913 RepID=UPI00234FF7D1|nr:transmembrane protein 54b isoform X3 [Ictalurus furcatus]